MTIMWSLIFVSVLWKTNVNEIFVNYKIRLKKSHLRITINEHLNLNLLNAKIVII